MRPLFLYHIVWLIWWKNYHLLHLDGNKLHFQKRKVKDLDKLKKFIKPMEVDEFVSMVDIPDKEKQDRLYTEVRYAMDTTLDLNLVHYMCGTPTFAFPDFPLFR